MKIKINNKRIKVNPSQTILEVCQENNIDIPFLCHHPDLEVKHHCGMCLVEVKGESELKHACSTVVQDKMEVVTESLKINEERTKNLQSLLEKHLLECDDCVWFRHCQLLKLSERFNIKPKPEKREDLEVFQSGSIVFDQTKCIGCENCVAVCPTGYLELNDKQRIKPVEDTKKDCVNCGQCIVHCPVGAIEGVGEFEQLEGLLKDSLKTKIVQFAPSIRTTIGEEFGFKSGEIVTGQLIAGLKQLGFDYVFDTASGADFTTMEESDELIERLERNENLPAMSSCCPAWVKYLEMNYPEFIPNLCTSRSPQAMLGGIIKTKWQKEGTDPANVFVVSVMPCVAKKTEIKREELKFDGIRPVDCVLSTRELGRLFKKNQIDLKNIKPQEADDPFGLPSGAGVIYGSSGGVFESAFRTAYFKMVKKELPDNAIKEIRGIEGVKRKEIKVKDRLLKICVVSGLKNAQKILEEVKANPKAYDAIEVMACPGGCIAGGGQLLPTNRKIVKKRSESLYTIDKKKKIRCAHNNPAIKQAYQGLFQDEALRKKILHTSFSVKNKTEIRKLKNSRETYDY